MVLSDTITLLSDFGTRDTYIGQMKGVIISINSLVRIIDITHEIEPQDIKEAAFLIKEYYAFFPLGTIHVAIVDPEVGSSRRPIIVKKDGYFFIGPDNGIFTMILKGNYEIFTIENRDFTLKEISNTFHGRDVFAPVAAHLSKGLEVSLIGTRVQDPVLIPDIYPRIESDVLYGEIVRFDRFGNAITNIDASTLKDFLGRRNFRIEVGGMSFDSINKSYFEGPVICLIGSSGYLEFGCYKDSFKELFKIAKGEEVMVRPII
ncbi:MAG: SAM-dependent chlorinase/fluorinase [Syntrophorhabdaceae bacterium]|nr:SAM-dependent chlorinase/fluorinase [Syntrophorhabdaceae bacterium]